jgi:hypothetical protein
MGSATDVPDDDHENKAGDATKAVAETKGAVVTTVGVEAKDGATTAEAETGGGATAAEAENDGARAAEADAATAAEEAQNKDGAKTDEKKEIARSICTEPLKNGTSGN